MLIPAGHKLRVRSTTDAENLSTCLEVSHVRRGREIVLSEDAELTRRSYGNPRSEHVQAVAAAWEQFRRKLATQGILTLPPDMLPLAQAIDRLKAAV